MLRIIPPAAAAQAPSSGRRAGGRLARWSLLAGLLLATGMWMGARLARHSAENPEATARGYLRYKEILSYVDRDYVDSVDAEGLTDYAVAQLLARLDPHSVYITPKDRVQADAFLQNSYDGIGLEFCMFRDTATVVGPVPGSPAEAAGLRAGDQLLRLDDQPVAGAQLDVKNIGQRLRGARGSTVRLLVARPGQAARLSLTLTRAPLANPSVEPAVLLEDGQTGYLKVSRFAATTYEEFKAQLTELQRRGLRRLVLDLRGNPGGYLDRATRLADEFIGGSRKLVYTMGRDEQYASQTYAHVAGEWEQGPLVVLVDENSASAAEVLAGALQDHDRALVVGRRTFGKGLVQQPIPLQGGGELRLTVARYYTPAGRCIQKPYGPDKATYNQEVLARASRGELTTADSARVPAGQRFRTDRGRLVYGGGGIMPDVFVPRDSLCHTGYFTQLEQRGAMQHCALRFFRRQRAALSALTLPQFQATFRLDDAELDELARLGTLAGLRADPAALRRCAPALRACLKVRVARLAYGAAAARTVQREQDPEVQQALHVVQDSTARVALLGH